jgi:hypothetical protein
LLARHGWRRIHHRVRPGLYSIGDPTPSSPVFVSANYTLSFDSLRRSLTGMHAYILVLDTFGINVWCAAGKGTFGTDELVNRIESTALAGVVGHREVILPQLGATGVAAHEVKKRTGFKVNFGPVQARDIPEFISRGEATPEMRLVRFGLWDRFVVVPVELVHAFIPMAVIAVAAYFLSGILACVAVVASVLAGLVLFPILLPWIPGHDFSVKGFILGALIAIPFALAIAFRASDLSWWERLLGAVPYALAMPAVTAFLTLNFTGSTTFTSMSAVRREIFTYIPYIAVFFGAGVVAGVSYAIVRIAGG